MKDINISDDKLHYSVFLKVSKTDPFRQGVHINIYSNNKLCPLSSMQQFYAMKLSQGAHAHSPLFCNNHSVVTRQQFISHIRHILSILALNETNYNGHTFRIGAATSAVAGGIEVHMIQTLGRWSSSCYTRYIRTSEEVLSNAQQKMCS